MSELAAAVLALAFGQHLVERGAMVLHRGANHLLGHCHEQRVRDPLARHVGDHKKETGVVDQQVVEQVAANARAGSIRA